MVGLNVLTDLIFSISKNEIKLPKNVVRKIRERCVTRIKGERN